MNRQLLFLIGVIIIGVLAASILKNQVVSPEPARPAHAHTDKSAVIAGEPGQLTPEPDPESAEPEECLNPSQLRTHPLIVAEIERLSAVADKGPYFDSYRGLDVATLTSLAESGDSAAMVLLGTHAELVAANNDNSQVLDLVSRNKEGVHASRGRTLSDESRAAFLEAADWYYRAALNGRVMALHRYGHVSLLAYGGPVELGWIGKEEYEALEKSERNFLDPLNIYNFVTFEVAPEILSGPMAEIRALIPKGSERTRPIADALMNRYMEDLRQAGLPLVRVNVSSLPSMDFLEDRLCPGYELDQVFD